MAKWRVNASAQPRLIVGNSYRILTLCPIVDGGFTGWTDWSACSRSCGPGVTSRHRTCSNPRPSAGGKDCSNLGSAFEQRSCLLTECPGRFRIYGVHEPAFTTYLIALTLDWCLN